MGVPTGRVREWGKLYCHYKWGRVLRMGKIVLRMGRVQERRKRIAAPNNKTTLLFNISNNLPINTPKRQLTIAGNVLNNPSGS